MKPSEKRRAVRLENRLLIRLPLYKEMEAAAVKQNTLVSIEVPLPDGQIAFLENTAEKCTSPQTKHSQEGMQVAKHWVQRVDTPDAMFRRLHRWLRGLADGWGKGVHQYIRNSKQLAGYQWRSARY